MDVSPKTPKVSFVDAQTGVNKAKLGGVTHGEYLQLDKLLGSQTLQSEVAGNGVADEHLFIITHQTYELRFKQIIFDLEHIMQLFSSSIFDEAQTLRVVLKLERIVKIFKLLVDQMLILETMSPLDFIEFRKYLTPASGFQSLQFRLLENKLGVLGRNRVKYNAQHYREAFTASIDQAKVDESETNPSLFDLVQKWLEQVPFAREFWKTYVQSVKQYLNDKESDVEKLTDKPAEFEQAKAEFEKIDKSFHSIIDVEEHELRIEKGDRRLSHSAMQGALFIYFHRDQPRCSQPYQILTYLMDIDSLITKWRYNHVMLVQRMLGSKIGTGGSSGYHYLRSTISDRYKVFLDLFNLSTWLVPREYIPKLSPYIRQKCMFAKLSVVY